MELQLHIRCQPAGYEHCSAQWNYHITQIYTSFFVKVTKSDAKLKKLFRHFVQLVHVNIATVHCYYQPVALRHKAWLQTSPTAGKTHLPSAFTRYNPNKCSITNCLFQTFTV